ncbi:NUMOD4 motif-containing HNH endonuclease [Rhodococcus qingshengii]|uniref:NUMOD4 motif-containing HNH endonuclease n=1 Tax=Rhodococcus qingshengii TaxID=334542 RepID=UPI003D272BA5
MGTLLYANEEWRAVVGREGEYEVSSLGRVRSLDRIVSNGSYRRGRVLRPRVLPSGYLRVALGAKDDSYIHRIVAAAFIGPAPDGFDVRHLDGSRAHNVPGNLCYGTRLENMADQRRHGTHGNTLKSHCPRGHLLQSPNLVASNLREGRRYCLSCRTASMALRRRKTPFTDAEMKSHADREYSKMCISAA